MEASSDCWGCFEIWGGFNDGQAFSSPRNVKDAGHGTPGTGRTVAMIETGRGVVYPNQCDAMGHMNVQYYVAAFDQAIWHLLLRIGFDPARVRDERQGWVDARYVIEFSAELTAGNLYVIKSAINKIGRKSLQTLHLMFRGDSDVQTASLEATSVYFDLSRRQSIPIPQSLREAAESAYTRGP